MKTTILIICIFSTINIYPQTSIVKPMLLNGGCDWELSWQDDFDYEDHELDQRWESQNGPSGHILCSRWRENAKVKDGFLRLINKKESRGGQDWTSGNIWTRQQFMYGYFECRYRYAAAPATNNSFWLMTKGLEPKHGKKFEIDINEGHFPNIVNTNIHNWTDITFDSISGKRKNPRLPKAYTFGLKPDVRIQLEAPLTTDRIRFKSQSNTHIHIADFRIFSPNANGYPKVLSTLTESEGVNNIAGHTSTRISTSGTLEESPEYDAANLIDGNPNTRWTSQREGEKWIEFQFGSPIEIGCVDFINGWQNQDNWNGLLSDYTVEYHNGNEWIKMASFDIKNGEYNFARDFQVYGLEWNEDELIFYLNGKEIRREKNEFSHSQSPIWLSLAIIPWHGNVTDSIDGTYMEVDYVRVYTKKIKNLSNNAN